MHGCTRIVGATKAALLLGTSLIAFAAGAQAQELKFNVPAQNAGSGIQEFGREANLQIMIAAADARGKKTNAVQGEFQPDEALKRLLAGTGIVVASNDGKAIVLGAESSAVGSNTTKNAQAARDVRAAASGAGAAGQAREIETVIVSAQKRDERNQDVPIPVTVVSAASLLDSNQARVQDYYTRIPGLNLTPSVQGQQNLSIRGITTGFANPTVGLTIDDVPFGSSGGLPSGLMVPDIDPSDLQRVEVLKGPQGTLYGASSLGGLFKLVTVDPTMDAFSGRFESGISGVSNGNEAGYQIRGSANIPITDEFAVRVSAFSRHDPGYIDNVQTGQKAINSDNVFGGRLSALWNVTDWLSIKLGAIIQNTRGNGQSEVDNLPGLGDLQQSRLINSGLWQSNIRAYSATIKADLGWSQLTSVTGYNMSSVHSTFDFTGSFAPSFVPIYGPNIGLPVYTDSRVNRVTQELRLDIPIGNSIDWLIGGFYSQEGNDFDQHTTVVNNATGALLGYRNKLDNGSLRIGEKAVFTDVTYRFSDRFDVQLGGRYSNIEQSKDAGTAQRFPPTGNGVLTPTAAISTKPDDVFTYLVTPRFKLTDDIMIYARGASGYRIGGGGVTSPIDNCLLFNFPCQYGPDQTKTYDLGTKGNLFDKLLSFDLSLYYIDWSSIQIQGYSPAAGTTFNTNGSHAKSEGVELSLEARPTDDLILSSWVSYNDAALTQALPIGPGLPLAPAGSRLPLGSRWSGSFSADRMFDLTQDLSLDLNGTVSYIGTRLGLFSTNGIRTQYPDYAKLDLSAKFVYQSWAVTLYMNNVNDTHAQLSGGPGFFPPTSAAIVQPRTFGVSVAQSF